MQFIDEATIFVRSGKGGNGAVAFNRTKTELGGPAGGDGGRGGSVVFVANPQLSTLLDFKFQQHYSAENGQSGMGREMDGRSGKNLIIPMPVGTVVSDRDDGTVLCDLSVPNKEYVICSGGRGGRGNRHFASATHQTPREAEQGGPATERWVHLELKLLADVGLLGFPNVGKSSLIAKVSRARPKIANYPFTTLVPQLGVVGLSGGRSFVMADIPGLIEGAAEGAGLGIRFLKHLQRTRVLLHLVDIAPVDPDADPVKDARAIIAELKKFSPDLAAKPRWLVLNKRDLLPEEDAEAKAGEIARRLRHKGPRFLISGVTGEGTKALCEAVMQLLEANRAKPG